ncbi:hypothetical protein CCZ01_06585 [Helicobacter monodelphidis]|uniref:hypothetical protein n=1 Tax=Helicobacter sp. 15-1451 TaxID=2004995 RepID=UPI000DCD40F9|nr:hypothetical protein [Helicobacter sp. 15-1451]RAX57239.1 hypothetical protein CCZ01_06585 [Helicobacter sp. 15-1451]
MKIIKLEERSFDIKGSMDTEEDYLTFKKLIREIQLQNGETIHFNILDAHEISPSIIGFLIKIHNQQKINIVMDIMSLKLGIYLRDVQLLGTFNVTLMNPEDY